MTSLQLTSVGKAFGRTPVLDDVTLEIPEASFTAILGPSGSGKTTLLRIVAGFERPDAGLVRLGDRTVDDTTSGRLTHIPPHKRGIGYVPQEGALFPHLDVAANVGFGLPRKERKGERVAELLELVGLPGLDDRFPHQLSGGQQQRVSLARALAVSPGIVLLDEPFSSLDAALRATVRSDVHAVLRKAGVTVVLVTHDQDEALSLADDVVVLRDGRVVQQGTPRALYRSPVDAQLASFLGDATLATGTITGREVDTVFGRLALRDSGKSASGEATVLLRPEQLELAPAAAPGLAGTVVRSEYYGHDAVVHVRTTVAGLDDVLVRLTGVDAPAPETAVTLTVRGEVTAWPD